MSASSRTTLIAPDLLRFACATAVVAFHLGTQIWSRPSPHAATVLAAAGIHNQSWAAWTRFGWVGVELFFVISGFMIAASAGGDGRAFMQRRLLRLVPAVWICASITLLCLVVSGSGPGAALGWLNAISFVPWGRTVDPSYWTLGIELGFYGAIAVFFRKAEDGERVDRIAAMLAIASLSFWLADLLLWRGPVTSPARLQQLLLLPHGCFFAGGMVVARWRERCGSNTRLWVATMAVVGGVLEIVHHTGEQAVIFQVGFTPLWPILIVAGGTAVLASSNKTQHVLGRWVDADAARLIGLSTYPLYLLHQEVGASLIAALGTAGLPVGASVLAAVFLLILLAFAIARWAEPALRAQLQTALRRHRERRSRFPAVEAG